MLALHVLYDIEGSSSIRLFLPTCLFSTFRPFSEHEVSIVLPDLQQQQQQNQSPPTVPSDKQLTHTESTLDTEPNYPKGITSWFTIVALYLVLMLGGLDANIVATAVPSIIVHFHAVADVGWYSSTIRRCTCFLTRKDSSFLRLHLHDVQ
jgi:hypothetical protein